MKEDPIAEYLDYITPSGADPTYTILKAHTAIERVLREHLRQVLPNPDALGGARLTFSQTLAVARATAPTSLADHWMWSGMDHLNGLRNCLAHEGRTEKYFKREKAYIEFIEKSSGAKLPEPATPAGSPVTAHQGHPYLAVDLVSCSLFGVTTVLLRRSMSVSELLNS